MRSITNPPSPGLFTSSPESVRVSGAEGVLFAGSDLPDRISDTDLDGLIEAIGLCGDRQLVPFELNLKRRPTKPHGERDSVQIPHRLRVEVERLVADVGPQVATLYQVQRSGHHPHVDALLG